jgi:type IV pilus biogenesis protein PilP
MFGIRNIGTVLAILLVFHGTALAVDNNITIRDLAIKQRELINAKLQAELNKFQPAKDTTVSVPGLSAPVGIMEKNDNQRDDGKDTRIILVAVYGVDKNLTADLLLNGAVVSANQNDVVNGWKIKSILPTHVVVTRGRETKTFSVSVADKQRLYESQQPSPFAPGNMNMASPAPSVFAPQTPNFEMR